MAIRLTSIWAVAVALMGVVALGVGAQQSTGTQFSTVSWESEIIDDFDQTPTDRWVVRGSKFTTVERDENGNPTKIYPEIADVPGYPEALFGRSKDKQDRGVLGIHGKFNRRGYNQVEIIPAMEAPADTPDGEIIHQDLETGKRWVSKPLDLPGRVGIVDLWAWGSNHRYYLEMYVRDYRGVDHVISMGDLNYFGWKNLRVGIPAVIPQAAQYVPRFRNMQITKFVLWTRPEEKVDNFYFYLDHLKVLTNLFESRYDGDELESPEMLEQVWGTTWD
jgi:hypothetical protein